jgi:predicted N-acyltransferase
LIGYVIIKIMEETSGLTIKITRKIEQIPSQEWGRVYPDILESYYFFKTIDESNFSGFSFYYILVYKESSLVGAVPCFFMDYPLDTTIQGPFKNFATVLRSIFPAIFSLKAVVCGSPTCEGRIGIIGEDKVKVLDTIVAGLQQIAKAKKASIIAFKDFNEDYTEILDHLLKKGFYKINGYPSVEIDMRFKSINEYLKSLSRVSRKSLKKKFKKVDALAQINLEISNDLGDSLDAAHQLYLQTFAKSAIHFEEYTKDFLKNISQNMPDEVKFFLWRVNGKLAAFNLCLASADVLVDEFLGLDYALAYKYNLYFITFRDIINWCIENGIKRYESGALTYDTKRRLGCRFVPLYLYVKHENKCINPFFKILCTLLKPENFDPALRAIYNSKEK